MYSLLFYLEHFSVHRFPTQRRTSKQLTALRAKTAMTSDLVAAGQPPRSLSNPFHFKELVGVGDFYDAASAVLRLRVFNYGHVNVLFIVCQRHVGRAIASGYFERVQQFSLR